MIRTLLGKKIPATRWAMTIGLGSSLLAMGSAYAQTVTNPTTSQAPETAAADRVIVTGSNIPSSEEVGAAPVDTVDQATRDVTGQEDVESVLTRATPAISSGGGNLGQVQRQHQQRQPRSVARPSVEVHGLPTLILLDGRRLTDSSAEAAGGSQFADVNLFPSALVKRIEILKDGASAIYGTEAVGGVVNVILDQEFQGFEVLRALRLHGEERRATTSATAASSASATTRPTSWWPRSTASRTRSLIVTAPSRCLPSARRPTRASLRNWPTSIYSAQPRR